MAMVASKAPSPFCLFPAYTPASTAPDLTRARHDTVHKTADRSDGSLLSVLRSLSAKAREELTRALLTLVNGVAAHLGARKWWST